MTGALFLDWATVAVSLFNTILLLWLGLTVLLNAERRTLQQAQRRRWGVWLIGGGLLMGGLFFASHSAILGHNLSYVSQGANFWWQVGWVPVVASPFAWYAGFWDDKTTRLHRRQRPWFILTLSLAAGIAGLLLFTNALPSYWQVVQLDLAATLSVSGVPLLILVYPLYVVLCIGLSLDTLRRPGPSSRLMGDLARRRARPWLVAASIALLLASLLVAVVVVWIALHAQRGLTYRTYAEAAYGVAWFDLLIASLIAAAIILIGVAATIGMERQVYISDKRDRAG
jgi:hypothetical protein